VGQGYLCIFKTMRMFERVCVFRRFRVREVQSGVSKKGLSEKVWGKSIENGERGRWWDN